MGRRHTVDEETAAIATERLARLLADVGPRRAMPDRRDGVGGREEPDQRDGPDRRDGPDQRDGVGRREEPDQRDGPDQRGPDQRDGPGDADEPRVEPVAVPSRPRAPESLPARARTFGRRHLGVLAVLLAIGLGAGGWALLRARPLAEGTALALSTTAEPASSPASPQAGAGSGRASSGTTPAAMIVVHVVGAVRRPGVVSLPERARVGDAIQAAGGLKGDARPAELNLAQVVQDGQQIVIGTTGRPGGEVRDGSTAPGASSGGGSSSGGSSSGGSSSRGSAGGGGSGSSGAGAGRATVDLNAATVAQLDTLPGVGPVTAERIIAWRTEHRRFSRVEELQEVDGIGPKTYAQLAPLVRV